MFAGFTETLKGKIFYEVEAIAHSAMAQLVAFLESAPERLFEQGQEQWKLALRDNSFAEYGHVYRKPGKRGKCNVKIEVLSLKTQDFEH